jgi:hypothetical protein
MLREAGEQVVWALPGQNGDAEDLGCDRVLAMQQGQWMVIAAGNGK